jgi:iron-sulfur cluster insertion protein
MNIRFTDRAETKVTERIGNIEGNLKLYYDTEGCGCVVSGVTVLRLETDIEGYERIETNYIPVYVQPSKKVFLDEDMTIDFVESANCFMLKCPSQILNPRMSLIVNN